MTVNFANMSAVPPSAATVSQAAASNHEVVGREAVDQEAVWPASGLSDVFQRLGRAFGELSADSAEEFLAKEEQIVTIDEDVGHPAFDNKTSLRDKIDEIKLLSSQLEADFSTEKNREILYCIYTRAAEAIGRNSAEAVKADTIDRIEGLVASGVIPEYVTSRGRKSVIDCDKSPQQWVSVNVLPKLDPDMRRFAYDMDMYRGSIQRLYEAIKLWRSRGVRGVERFAARRR